MGLLDQLLGGAGGQLGDQFGNENQRGSLMDMATSVIGGQPGGLSGLLDQFRSAGLGQQADSWVSTGRNQPIDGDVLSQVLGSGQLDSIAQKLGVPRREAADQVASALPEVVDRMTPQGSVPPDSDDLVNRALEILQRGGR